MHIAVRSLASGARSDRPAARWHGVFEKVTLSCFATSPRPRLIPSFLVCAGVANYEVLIKPTVVEDNEAIASKVDRRRVLGKIAAPTFDPRPGEAEQLPGRENQYRICLDHHRLI